MRKKWVLYDPFFPQCPSQWSSMWLWDKWRKKARRLQAKELAWIHPGCYGNLRIQRRDCWSWPVSVVVMVASIVGASYFHFIFLLYFRRPTGTYKWMPKVCFLAAERLEVLTGFCFCFGGVFWTSYELGFRKVAWTPRKQWVVYQLYYDLCWLCLDLQDWMICDGDKEIN